MDLQSKFLGGMVGTALGDALGERAFGEPLDRLIPRDGQLTYTDDTAMAIGIAESLAVRQRIDEKHLGDRFRFNYNREPHRGYGGGPPSIFKMVEWGKTSYSTTARSLYGGQGSLGNGAAMRVAPVGLFFYDAPDLYEQARASAVITHAHPVGVDGAALVALAVAEAVKLDPAAEFPREQICDKLLGFARTEEFKIKLRVVCEMLADGAPPNVVAGQIGRSVHAQNSVPYALYSFIRFPQSFKDCLFCAIGNGGDVDTLWAMACAIAGAFLGVEAIPQDWRERLENREYIEKLATLLWQLKTGRAARGPLKEPHLPTFGEEAIR
jgi:poly(ADP-ribose) glycohydrolase ARH3